MSRVDLGEVLDDITIVEMKGQRYIKINDLEDLCNFLADVNCTNTNQVLKQCVEKLKQTK
jgi:virulence-associated protein VapD